MADKILNMLRDVSQVLAAQAATAEAVLTPIADHMIDTFGLKLVTVTARDPKDGYFVRLYSSMPDAYAAQGRKPPNETDWSRHVIDRHQTYVANDYESLAKTMYDHEQIKALGMESLVNVPIILSGEVIGTLNCLGESGHFDAEKVEGCEAMSALVAMALTLAEKAGDLAA